MSENFGSLRYSYSWTLNTTPQPLYNTIVAVQAYFHVSYVSKLCYKETKIYSYTGISVLNNHLGSSIHPCYIQYHVVTNHVKKRFLCYYVNSEKNVCGINKALEQHEEAFSILLYYTDLCCMFSEDSDQPGHLPSLIRV